MGSREENIGREEGITFQIHAVHSTLSTGFPVVLLGTGLPW